MTLQFLTSAQLKIHYLNGINKHDDSKV